MQEDAVILAAGRTPIGNFGGSLAALSGSQLGAAVIQGVLSRSGVGAADVDEVILGQVLTAGAGQNPARQAAMEAGIPDTVPAMT
ncbi:MAG: acetyl-CoA C-acetyltransferase, partial [Gammaproteobacteria bacterium]|nr:acetyl-CoA C-acetyltransferase [Gammaproteobacteria bacterium]